ncbi:ATP-dependent DNA helicase [Woodsholea maritima]|uniref:ATP-dependent DNA helicase n=1 Tax=Woodsholea maritima TaxID=240237 RepID=UPI000379EA07|nr:AAA family ATPase [Woodsholea maritima]
MSLLASDPNVPALAADQTALINFLIDKRPNLFLTGRAGTGKTTLLREFLRRAGARAAVVAPTGVAAMHVGGQTLHSFFRLPPRLIEPADIKRLRNARALQALETLVIDEISMVRSDVMWAIDASLRLNRNRQEPFGGVQVILVGDLAQLPPIAQGEEGAYLDMAYGGPFFFHPPVFRDAGFSYVELEQVYRQSDPDFVNVLNGVRDGDLREDQASLLNARVTGRSGLEASASHVVLTATNQAAFNINYQRLEGLPGTPKVFGAKVEGQFEERAYPTEDPLVLKAGARVMMIRNDPQGRWVNGSLGEVAGFEGDKIRIKIGNDQHLVEPQKWERYRYAYDAGQKALSKDAVGGFTQFPLRLAWAMTIHKAQGLTLDKVYIDIARNLFAHGQAYVALSRARSLEGLELSRSLRPQDIIIDQRVFDVKAYCDPLPQGLLGR